MASLRHNVLVRRSLRLAAQIPRALRRLSSGPGAYALHPPIMANSFPKSGTHLLLQIVEALPGTRNYGTFVATQPVFPYRQRSAAEQARIIGSTAPGEVVAGHMYHDPDVAAALARVNAIHFFVYRDPRDVVVSEAHYLTSMNRFHRMHGYFSRRLATMDERIMAAIRGVDPAQWPHAYPNVATRFGFYEGWLTTPEVTPIRYEDLMGPDRSVQLERIAARYVAAGGAGDRAAMLSSLARAIQPEKSRTFREAKSGNWRAVFTAAHTQAMKEVAGDLLVRLGYERGLDW